MRILYNNLLETATLSATNENANYPVENVYDSTLQTKFKTTTSSTVITATLAEASTVSTFAFGAHNILTAAVKLTDTGASTTTYNYTNADLIFDSSTPQAMVYIESGGVIDPQTNIVEIEYTITASTAVDIGGMSAGTVLQFDYMETGSKTGFISTGSRQKSDGGVTFNVDGVVLETFGCTVNANLIADFNAQQAFFRVVQTYKPYFVDRWEASTQFPVLFAQNTRDVEYTKGEEGIIFDSFRLELEECK
jgi:hypothetical protein